MVWHTDALPYCAVTDRIAPRIWARSIWDDWFVHNIACSAKLFIDGTMFCTGSERVSELDGDCSRRIWLGYH